MQNMRERRKVLFVIILIRFKKLMTQDISRLMTHSLNHTCEAKLWLKISKPELWKESMRNVAMSAFCQANYL